jgi:hypothetical protein
MANESNSTSGVESFASFPGNCDGFSDLIFRRKAKDYTYLYGNSLDDPESSLTRHLKSAFVEGADEYFPYFHLLTVALSSTAK